jgi:hypothetical protein
MFRISRALTGAKEVVFTLSGRLGAENIAEVRALIGTAGEGRRKILDLRDITLVDQDAVSFLEYCEAGGLEFENCPAYIREWMDVERGGVISQSVGRS